MSEFWIDVALLALSLAGLGYCWVRRVREDAIEDAVERWRRNLGRNV